MDTTERIHLISVKDDTEIEVCGGEGGGKGNVRGLIKVKCEKKMFPTKSATMYIIT